MPRTLDLDTLRAARAEASGEQPTLTAFGKTYELPAAMPFAIVDALVIDDAATFRNAVVSLVGERGLAEMLAAGASVDDMRDLIVRVPGDIYGAADPEAFSAS